MCLIKKLFKVESVGDHQGVSTKGSRIWSEFKVSDGWKKKADESSRYDRDVVWMSLSTANDYVRGAIEREPAAPTNRKNGIQ